MLLQESLHLSDRPKLWELAGGCALEDVLIAIAAISGVAVDRLTARRGADRTARALAMYCVDHFCCATSVQSRLAEMFGISLGAFSTARQRVDERRRADSELQTQIDRIAKRLQDDIKTEI